MMTSHEIADIRARLCRLEKVIYILIGAVAATGLLDLGQVVA